MPNAGQLLSHHGPPGRSRPPRVVLRFAPLLAMQLVGPTSGWARQATSRIEDNSFLLEEAYNQERRVVQHILTFNRARSGGAWAASATDEWPIRGQRHQLSYTGTLLRNAGPTGGTGFGDLAINYRWQAVGGEGARVWAAPRLTLVLPLGDPDRGRGTGGVGFEAGLPVSITLGPRFTSHFNAALLVNPGARRRGIQGVSTRTARLGASLIGDLTRRINLLVESVWESSHEVAGLSRTISADHWVLSPGVRWAYDFSSGLQIVPGLAYTMQIDRGGDPDAVFFYLSFEYPFGRTR